MIPPPREGRDHNGFCGGGYLNHMEPDITAFTRDEEIANQISRPGISNSEDLCCRRSLPFLPPPPALAPSFTPLRKLQYFTNQAPLISYRLARWPHLFIAQYYASWPGGWKASWLFSKWRPLVSAERGAEYCIWNKRKDWFTALSLEHMLALLRRKRKAYFTV